MYFISQGYNDLAYHIELVDLMALLTEGMNVYTEIKCQVRDAGL